MKSCVSTLLEILGDKGLYRAIEGQEKDVSTLLEILVVTELKALKNPPPHGFVVSTLLEILATPCARS